MWGVIALYIFLSHPSRHNMNCKITLPSPGRWLWYPRHQRSTGPYRPDPEIRDLPAILDSGSNVFKCLKYPNHFISWLFLLFVPCFWCWGEQKHILIYNSWFTERNITYYSRLSNVWWREWIYSDDMECYNLIFMSIYHSYLGPLSM